MQPSLHARKHIRAHLIERLADRAGDDQAGVRSAALNLFFEASFKFESLRDLKSLCVLVPDVCLGTPASLYMRGPKDTLRLRRTTNTAGPKPITFPEPSCPSQTAIMRLEGLTAVPICETGTEPKLLGMLCLHKDLIPAEEAFYLEFVRCAAQLMSVKQITISNRQHLTFINNLVRDIGHNVIVPNMHFKLLFLQMEKQLERLGRKVDSLSPVRSDAPDRDIRRELPVLIKDLQARQRSISRRFQQSSLFLESLLRRGHFEKGRYDLLPRPCRFKSQIFEPQLERFLPLLSAQGITIRIAPDVHIDEDIVLEADLGLISQVFANLLSNAVKYTEAMPRESGRKEKLALYGWETKPHAFGPGQPGIELYIRTTGHEIPDQDRPKLFNADFRCSATEKVEGSGHGLFFVKQIVELHNGRVGYSYAAPMNTFHITLPCQGNPPSINGARIMPQSILIIEDDEPLRASLATNLKDAGFAVNEATDAEQAMHLFMSLAPDVVLLDLGISGDEGMGLLENMKLTRPFTPVIIVSGRTHISYAIDAFKAGAFDYVTKPIVSMDIFINGLRNCLAQSRLQRRILDTQEHLIRLVRKLPVIIFIINRDLEFEFLNQATTSILGYSPQEILKSPRSFLRRIVREDRERFLLAMRNSLKPEPAEFNLEFRFLHKKGYPVSLMLQSIASPLPPSGAPDRIEGMIMDMTRNSYLDKLLLQNEKLSMLRTMTEEVAHEIRNPLVALGGFARKLRQRYPEAIETRVILEECSRLERLLQRINAYLEPINVTLTHCLLPPTVNFIMRLVSSRLEHKSIRCDIELEDDLPAVLADQEFLHRIFIYLIGHGADIVEQSGSISITASQASELVVVSLVMEPVRTPASGHERLIMPFEDDEMNLAMCLRLVERIGGHLHMEQENSVARLTMSLPKTSAREDQ